MATSASIYQTIRPQAAPNLLSQALQAENLMQARRAGRMDEMKLDEYNRGIQRTNKLQELLGAEYADDAAREGALLKGGFVDQASKLRKDRTDVAKTAAETKAKQADIFGKYLNASKEIAGRVMANPTPESAAQALDYMESIGAQFGLDVSKDMKAQRQGLMQMTSPEQIKQWAAGHALQAEKLLPQFQRSDIGGQVQTMSIDPVTGKPTVTGTTAKTQTPDSVASVQATMRGQNMTDARAREANNLTREANATVYDTERGILINKGTGLARPAATFDGKPVGAKEKPLTEGQAKAVAFASRMENSNNIIEGLEKKGASVSIPGARAGYGVGTAINAVQPEELQKLDQAKRDFVNAILRRESGAVISMEEFANAEKQYFPQIGEGKSVRDQKAANRRIALQGMKADIPKERGDMTKDIIKNSGGANPSSIDLLLDKYK